MLKIIITSMFTASEIEQCLLGKSTRSSFNALHFKGAFRGLDQGKVNEGVLKSGRNTADMSGVFTELKIFTGFENTEYFSIVSYVHLLE